MFLRLSTLINKMTHAMCAVHSNRNRFDVALDLLKQYLGRVWDPGRFADFHSENVLRKPAGNPY